jgi:hypothetical protein
MIDIDDTNHGDADAPAADRLRDAVRNRAQRLDGRLYDRRHPAQRLHMLGFALVAAVAIFVTDISTRVWAWCGWMPSMSADRPARAHESNVR